MLFVPQEKLPFAGTEIVILNNRSHTLICQSYSIL